MPSLLLASSLPLSLLLASDAAAFLASSLLSMLPLFDHVSSFLGRLHLLFLRRLATVPMLPEQTESSFSSESEKEEFSSKQTLESEVPSMHDA